MLTRLLSSAGKAAGFLSLALSFAACTPSFSVFGPSSAARPTIPAPPTQRPTPYQGQACLDELYRLGAIFEMVAERAAAGPCQMTNGVSVSRTTIPLERPATMACPLAATLTDFENQVVQPAAQKHLKLRVAVIRHYGAYECRNIRNSRRLSEHGRGLAFDISGFELDDGTTVMVKDHWRNAGARSRFLQEVAQGACRLFSVVLTPKSDADHLDHLHLDIGTRPHCGA